MEDMAMTSTRYLVLAAGLLGLAAGVVVLLTRGGNLVVPRSERTTLRGARAAVHEELERRDSVLPAGRTREDGLWRVYLDVVEKHLGHGGDVGAAVRAWHAAHGAALHSRGWEGMIAVGDAFVAIGRASGSPAGARMNARDAYLTALIRARRDRSVEGALRSAEAFWRLDDRAVAEQCLHIAGQLAGDDRQAQERVREVRQRWVAPSVAPAGREGAVVDDSMPDPPDWPAAAAR
jgi:hypothetical protein